MSLKEQILNDMKSAMREKQASKLESIRMLRAAIQRKEVDDQTEIHDEDVLAIVQKMIKQSQDAIKQFTDGDRADLANKEQLHVDNLKVMPQVKVKNDEPFDVILRRFRRSCEKAGIFTEMRRREFYEKPTSVRKRKGAAAKKREMKRASRGRIRTTRLY